jgi:hypothetical protein
MKRSMFVKLLFAGLLGALVGLFVGIAVEWYGSPTDEPSTATFHHTNLYTGPRTIQVHGRTPAYIVLPAFGAAGACFWIWWRNSSRKDGAKRS